MAACRSVILTLVTVLNAPRHPLSIPNGSGADRWARIVKMALMMPARALYLTPRPPLQIRRGGERPACKSPLRLWRGDLGVR
jgi:hypothetical protein